MRIKQVYTNITSSTEDITIKLRATFIGLLPRTSQINIIVFKLFLSDYRECVAYRNVNVPALLSFLFTLNVLRHWYISDLLLRWHS